MSAEKKFGINSEHKTAPEWLLGHFEKTYDPDMRRIWGAGELKGLTIEEYAERLKKHGSGHLAIHATPVEFTDLILKHGFIAPTTLLPKIYEREGIESDLRSFKRANYLASSQALHFSIDDIYGKGFGDWRGTVVVTSIEALIENKAFGNIPFGHREDIKRGSTSANDMMVAGFSEDPQDESNKFNIDELGIVLIPKNLRIFIHTQEPVIENWNEAETPTVSIEEYLATLRSLDWNVPKRIFLYSGNTPILGLQEFLTTYKIKLPTEEKKIVSSGPVVVSHFRGKSALKFETGFNPGGEGEFYRIQPLQ